MTFQTRTVIKRQDTYVQTRNEGTHVNRITLKALPWETVPEEKQHPRPVEQPQFKVSSPRVSVKTYQPTGDPFSAWDESELAERMRASARSEGKRAGMLPELRVLKENGAKRARPRREFSFVMIRLLSHLHHGDVSRAALRIIFGNSGNFSTQRRRAEELGWVKGGDGPNDRMWITSAGLKALAEMRANAVEEKGRLMTGGSGQYGGNKQ